MKKSLLTLGVATLAISSFASTRILYKQNFENVATPAEAGWSNYRGSMTIASDDFGKFLEINQNGQNGGSTYLKWGQEIFMNDEGNLVLEDGTYDVHFEYAIKNKNCNQYNTALTIFTNNDPGTNQPYRNRWSPAGYWQNYLFDVSQVDDGTKDALLYTFYGDTSVTETAGEDGTVTYSYGINYSDPTPVTLAENTWYEVDLHVDVEARTVEYNVQTNSGDQVVSGTYEVPTTNIADGSDISMFAEGLNVMLARTLTTYAIDNIKVSYESEFDNANPPSIALTSLGVVIDPDDPDNATVDYKVRTYTIGFLEGETLHFIGTDSNEVTVEYEDCEGEYKYSTTTSGNITAWTTSGTATSEQVSVEVECVPVVLPEVTASISSVSTGFGKTYTLSVSNAEVPLRPTISINYEFVGVNGERIAEEGVYSGTKVNVTEAGTLTITSEAFGYEAKTVKVENNIEFAEKKVWDFARLTDEELAAAGFSTWETLNSSATSGFNNWTARKRLYYLLSGSEHENDEGEIVYDNAYPFGFVSEDNTTNVVEYSVIEDNSDNTKYFKGLEIFGNDRHVGMLKHLGLYNDETANNYNDLTIKDIDTNDFVVVNIINNYGGNSNHPICATNEEYYAQLAGDDAVLVAKNIVADPEALPNLKREGTSYSLFNEATGKYDLHFALYRIDTALTKLSIFSQVGVPDAVEAIGEVAGDNNWYSIDGVRVAEPTRAGLYIHNGKKVIVK